MQIFAKPVYGGAETAKIDLGLGWGFGYMPAWPQGVTFCAFDPQEGKKGKGETGKEEM
jgi:hypothetical protein